MNSGDHLIALLSSPNEEINEYALKTMLKSMEYQWTYFIESLDLLKKKYNESPKLRVLCAFVISQINFYGENLEESVAWILKSKNRFNINERNLFTDSIIELIIRNYIECKDCETSEGIKNENFGMYEEIVVQILESSFKMNNEFDKKLLVGLAIETEKFEFIKGFIKGLPDVEFYKFFNFIESTIQTNVNKNEIYSLFLDELVSRPEKNYELISKCYFNLKNHEKQGDLFLSLLDNETELCYQLAVDIQETGNVYYIKLLNDYLQEKLGDNFKNLKEVLNGDLKSRVVNQFMSQNNNVDFHFFKELGKRWISKNSTLNNSFGIMYSMALLGTKDITLLSEFKKKLEKVKNWSLFTLVSSIGLIFPFSDISLKLKELTIDETSDYSNGGRLYAQGISFFGKKLSEEDLNTHLENLSKKDKKEGTLHGTALLLGLRNVLSNNQMISEKLIAHLYGEKANIGEASGYALGLIKATHFENQTVETLINISRNNPHDRIARSMMCSMGLLALGNRDKVMNVFNDLIKEKDEVLRMGAVNVLGMAYFDTCENKVISLLLQIAATDLSNDVRRASVLALCFVMYSRKSKAFSLLEMLSKSYNEYVRHGVALGLGIIGAGTFDKKIHKLLLVLWKDDIFHVQQATAISFGLLHQLATPSLDPEMVKIREEMITKAQSKYTNVMTKFGCYLGIGLMQSGGGNAVLSLVSSSGQMKIKNIIGIYMFTFYWYWMPLTNMIGLALEPTFLAGLLKDFNIPRGFQFISKAPKKYFDYYKVDRKVEEKVKQGPVLLSTTKKVNARNLQTSKIQKKNEEDKKMVIEEKKKDKKVEETKKVEEEAKFFISDNPSRVIFKQIPKIDFNIDNKRYEVVYPRKRGIVFLKDLKPEDPEVYTNNLPEEKYLIPPKDFIFDETVNK